MRRIALAAAVAGLLAAGVAPATASILDPPNPPPGKPVQVVNKGGCYYVVVNGKYLPQNGLCYLGPPPPEPIP